MKYAHYLSPKTDLTFKRVFYEQPYITVDFLNALLPFENIEEERIAECLEINCRSRPSGSPVLQCGPLGALCRNIKGGIVYAEMRLLLTGIYSTEMLREYIQTCPIPAERYKAAQKVFSLNLIDGTVSDSRRYCHDFRLTGTGDEAQGNIRMLFIELPKVGTDRQNRTHDCNIWLKFLSETGAYGEKPDRSMILHPGIGPALSLLESTAYSDKELNEYAEFITTVKTFRNIAGKIFKEGFDKGRIKGLEEGFDRWYREGVNTGSIAAFRQFQRESAVRMKEDGIPDENILKWTGIRKYELDLF